MTRSVHCAMLVAAAGLSACGVPRSSAVGPRHRLQTSTASSCASLPALVDLHRQLRSEPIPRSSLAALVDVQQELAYAREAQRHVGAEPTLDRLATLLESRRARISAAVAGARDSHAAASAAIRSASTCRGIDLRELAKHGDNNQRDLATAKSKACEGALRLWAATKNVDLTSSISTRRVSAQLAELRVDRATASVQSELSSTLTKHADRLKQLEVAETETEAHELMATRDETAGQIEETYRRCLAPSATKSTFASGIVDPRSATVMVRPTWSGAMKRLPSAEQVRFGSGFVVRWPRARGGTEALVVTNRHVMVGATEADILFAPDVDARNADAAGDGAKRATRHATLVTADASDDVAVLRVEDAAAPGIAFRYDPPREQEVVVAAGFPGVGATPSFQVTKGTVSNAHFGSEEKDLGIAYVQHTAPIDPGNSGGPLLDADGRLIGMNTAKLGGRDSVNLAIPSSRIRFALSRAERPAVFGVLHAEASCNAALGALAAEGPSIESIRHFGLSLFEESERRTERTTRRSARIIGEVAGPLDEAAVRAFEVASELVDAAGGVSLYETCADVAASKAGTFTATFRTRTGAALSVTLSAEPDAVRVASVTRR